MAFSLAVCVLDIFLTVHLSESLLENERNPIARLLIFETASKLYTLHNGIIQRHIVFHTDVSWLVLVKVLGLLVSQRIFARMLDSADRFFVPVIVGVAAFQVWLLVQFLS